MASKGQSLKQKRINNDSLLEVLRDLSGNTAKSFNEDFFGKIPQDVFAQTGIKSKTVPNSFESHSTSNFEQSEEIRNLRNKLRQAEFIRHEGKVVFSAQQQEEKTQVTVLQQEVQKLAGATQNLAQEIKIAAFQTPVAPGTYHVSFFEKMISFVKSLTQKIEDASLWMTTFNSRAKKQPHYWAQANKSGSKWLQSQERYMATQAG